MRNKRAMSPLVGILSAATMFVGMMPVNVLADELHMCWVEENGNKYWYENGVRQGTEGRGKEIYDPASGAWYWLDAIDDGKMATSKDVYQESWAGDYADNGDGTGKWVRYDENGHMVKGWDTTEAGTYYFDLVTGAMAKGAVTIDDKSCVFDVTTGIGLDCQWYEIDGVKYWYEGGVRQGTEGRGKEIYDPASDAWYWLDAVDGGRVATSKDVYQESSGGKWVRYDANGHMIKGWDEQNGNTYYFDPITGAMAKGAVTVDGTTYYFNETTGICEGEYVADETSYMWRPLRSEWNPHDESLYDETREYEYNELGKMTRETDYRNGEVYLTYNYTYDENGNYLRMETTYVGERGPSEVREYEYENGLLVKTVYYDYGTLSSYDTYEYDGNGNCIRRNAYESDGTLSYYDISEYDRNGNRIRMKNYSGNGTLSSEYEYDENGNQIKYIHYIIEADGTATFAWHTESIYNNYNGKSLLMSTIRYDENGAITGRDDREYDGDKLVSTIYYNKNGVISSRSVSEYTGYSENPSVGDTYTVTTVSYDADGNVTSESEATYIYMEIQ